MTPQRKSRVLSAQDGSSIRDGQILVNILHKETERKHVDQEGLRRADACHFFLDLFYDIKLRQCVGLEF